VLPWGICRIETGHSRSTPLASGTIPEYGGTQGLCARKTSANWNEFRREPPRHR